MKNDKDQGILLSDTKSNQTYEEIYFSTPFYF